MGNVRENAEWGIVTGGADVERISLRACLWRGSVRGRVCGEDQFEGVFVERISLRACLWRGSV